MALSSIQPEPAYEQPRLFVIGSVAKVTQIGESNPKNGALLDGNNQNNLGKTSTWPD